MGVGQGYFCDKVSMKPRISIPTIKPRFPGNPLIIRVPFFLISGLNINKETPNQKGQKGTPGEARKGLGV